jgi:hypothetical protein
MHNVNNSNPDNVISQLIDKPNVQKMKEIHITRSGTLQSRKVRKGDQECTLNQLIGELGKRINEANIKQSEPDLGKLKNVLTAVSEAEQDNRTGILSHLFSSRDEDVDKLQNKVDIKINQHEIYEKLKNGYDLKFNKRYSSDEEMMKRYRLKMIFSSLSTEGLIHSVYQDGEESLSLSSPVYLMASGQGLENYTYSYKEREGAEKVSLYIKVEGPPDNRNYIVLLADGNLEATERVITNLAKAKFVD